MVRAGIIFGWVGILNRKDALNFSTIPRSDRIAAPRAEGVGPTTHHIERKRIGKAE